MVLLAGSVTMLFNRFDVACQSIILRACRKMVSYLTLHSFK